MPLETAEERETIGEGSTALSAMQSGFRTACVSSLTSYILSNIDSVCSINNSYTVH